MHAGGLRALVLVVGALGCARTLESPPRPIAKGIASAPPGFTADRACGAWSDAVRGESSALSHVTFPEGTAPGCFVAVDERDGVSRATEPPEGCGFPASEEARNDLIAHARKQADNHDRASRNVLSKQKLPAGLRCELPEETFVAAAQQNARAYRYLANQLERGKRFPYGAVATFGFGYGYMEASRLVPWRPGDRCPELDPRQMELLSVNVDRAYRVTQAKLGGVGPVAIVSGGAVHAPLVEAFALMALATCRFGMPEDAVMLDPCADHTHTNIRNTGSALLSMGGRTAYIVTDDGIQSDYLQDWNGFHFVFGSIDHRSLRDWGTVLGSWRQASVSHDAGFWYTPYRFYEDPAHHNLTCVDAP